MSIIALQTAFVTLALLNPQIAFETLDAQVAKIDEWEEERVVVDAHDDEEALRIVERFTLRGRDGTGPRPFVIFTRKEGYTDPEYLVADYADGTRVIELPEDEVALIRRTVDGQGTFGVLRYVNQPGMGFVPHG